VSGLNLRNESGQMVLEYILIAVIFTGITVMTTQFFQDNEILRTLVAKPWQSLAGMVQNGDWGTPENTMNVHPNGFACMPLYGVAMQMTRVAHAYSETTGLDGY
jgi:hypothetical protein